MVRFASIWVPGPLSDEYILDVGSSMDPDRLLQVLSLGSALLGRILGIQQVKCPKMAIQVILIITIMNLT